MIPIFVALVAATFLLVAFTLQWSWQYWQRRNVEVLPTDFPFGNAKDLILQKRSLGEGMGDFYSKVKKEKEKVRYAGYYFLFKPQLVIIDLDLIKSILTSDFNHFTDHALYVNVKADPLSGHLFGLKGQQWKELRSKLTPTFSSGKLKMMFPILESCAKGLIDLVDKHVEDERTVEIKDAVSRYTIDIIGSAAFGIECNSLKNPDCEFRKYGQRVFDSGIVTTIKFFCAFLFPQLMHFFNVPLFIKDVRNFFLNLVKETVTYREANDVQRKDFLQLLIQLNKEDQNDASKRTLTMNELAAQMFAFFIAGYETSSTTLTFCLYELAQNSEIQGKLRREIKEVLGKRNFKIDYDALNEMVYMNQCINETLRKYPPIPFLTRECTATYRVPDSDLVIEKGTQIQIPILGIQRDPEFFTDPLKFDPERFSPSNKEDRHPCSWLPFGDGPRLCIGLRLGLMQTKVALATLLSNYEFSLNEKTEVPLTMNNKTITLAAKNGVWLNAVKVKN